MSLCPKGSKPRVSFWNTGRLTRPIRTTSFPRNTILIVRTPRRNWFFYLLLLSSIVGVVLLFRCLTGFCNEQSRWVVGYGDDVTAVAQRQRYWLHPDGKWKITKSVRAENQALFRAINEPVFVKGKKMWRLPSWDNHRGWVAGRTYFSFPKRFYASKRRICHLGADGKLTFCEQIDTVEFTSREKKK